MDKDGTMGGSSINTYRVRSQEFVSKQNIDLDRSQKRSSFDRFIGRYRICNIHGKGFMINRYFFFKNDFETIKSKLHDILGVKYG